MRLVIDLQGAQGSNRNRGIGRYCLSLTQGLARLRGEHEVIVVLSSLFPETIESLRIALSDVLPADAVRIMDLPGPVPDADPGCDSRRLAAELIREQFLASLEPDFVLITSLFEGLGDSVVSSVAQFTSSVPTAVVLYDLIPLINSDIYLKNPVLNKWYQRKLAHLRNADFLLSISQSSRCEAIEWLDADEDKVFNISTAAEPHFTPQPVSPETLSELASKYGLVRPFVMYTGGIDHRKNIEGLIEAYSLLDVEIRRTHQLAIVCSIQDGDRKKLTKLASDLGLGSDELVLTGYIPENDLLACYRACEVFVFPSWHEGFGLPALEAMQCGRAVIASNRSSLPEVIGTKEALFDPFDIAEISASIKAVLTDSKLRTRLQKHGLKQAKSFSWELTAKAAWDAINKAIGSNSDRPAPAAKPSRRPRLAFVSPLPPAASGIADYSAELLPELARHYRIDVVVNQAEVDDEAILANYPVRSVEWFKQNSSSFDRVLYHFGNSDFHIHMFDLLKEYPGVVVLHDFFLSGIVAHRDVTDHDPGCWARELLASHGWPAVKHRYKAEDTADVVWAYPCNISVLQDAVGVIVHADYSRKLAREFYGDSAASDWALIPHLRQPMVNNGRKELRAELGFGDKDFVVCSFGLLGPTKLNHRLLAAWQASPLAKDHDCHLVFVGKNDSGEYGQDLTRRIRAARSAGRIEITGWVDQSGFRNWLKAADMAVQLRTLSRGETSGTVLDCMNMGLATIVNGNGSMAELQPDAVWLMPDAFSDAELIEALTRLYEDEVHRKDLGSRALRRVQTHNNPKRCAADYFEAIESAYGRADVGQFGLEKAIPEYAGALVANDWQQIARAIERNRNDRLAKRRIYVDISELVQKDWGSGIQRVVRSILGEWLNNHLEGYIIEPVYAQMGSMGYRYAREFTSRMLDIWPFWCNDDVVQPVAGDIFVGLDLQPAMIPQQQALLSEWRMMGVSVQFVLYDLLPAIAPEYFVPGARPHFQTWLETISKFDSVICISRAVADEYSDWLDHYGPARLNPLDIDWFHLGGDMGPAPEGTSGIPAESSEILAKLRNSVSFLTVATIEPRKGFRQTLDAMELLWEKGENVTFAIVGKPGWLMDDFIERLESHPELGKRLFWLRNISDDYLHAVYGVCSYLIAASEAEGFGLPLIEAAQYNLPVLARDIPVFREVAGKAATYFPNSNDPDVLAKSIRQLARSTKGVVKHPSMKWLTWAQSADMLLNCVLRRNDPYRRWMPSDILRFWGSDHRLHSRIGSPAGTVLRTTQQAGYLVYGPYDELGKGSWSVTASGEAAAISGTERLEIASDQGTVLHFSAPLVRKDNAWSVDGHFVLKKSVTDFELRLLVSARTDLALYGITLTPASGEQGTQPERQKLKRSKSVSDARP